MPSSLASDERLRASLDQLLDPACPADTLRTIVSDLLTTPEFVRKALHVTDEEAEHAHLSRWLEDGFRRAFTHPNLPTDLFAPVRPARLFGYLTQNPLFWMVALANPSLLAYAGDAERKVLLAYAGRRAVKRPLHLLALATNALVAVCPNEVFLRIAQRELPHRHAHTLSSMFASIKARIEALDAPLTGVSQRAAEEMARSFAPWRSDLRFEQALRYLLLGADETLPAVRDAFVDIGHLLEASAKKETCAPYRPLGAAVEEPSAVAQEC